MQKCCKGEGRPTWSIVKRGGGVAASSASGGALEDKEHWKTMLKN